ncbi:DUF4012 domain-containing protein [Demequina sp. SYSU T00192]|uniref:DUF4012 domain-containing protein n=1 Tax=Demequina litoralis TaxID=3051660 RepID=A0ABT8G8G1_9MICO|nr:DUF4012 domain-containing protein [Demequina sp. SYSU T00192]MDN4475418.1 DUF4012 domain-containing protein [Demequina sp. SYSU T00192]
MAPQRHSSSRTPRRLWRWLGAVSVAAFVIAAAALAWDGYRLLRAKDELATHAAAAQSAIGERDATTLVAEAAALESAARTFAAATDGPQWWLAAHLPWVGDQAVPLQRAGAAVDEVAEGALSPLASLGDLSALEAPEFVDGRIDPYLLEPYRATLSDAAEVLADQVHNLETTDLEGTVSAVRDPFLDLADQLATVSELVNGAHVAAEVLPTMLGGEDVRTYLVMVQNNAEPRTTGGIPGAVLEVTVDDGVVSLERYATANSMIDRTEPVTLTEDELRIFGRRMAVYPQNVNFTPEYPRSAQLMSEFWAAEYGEVADGILSIDPVALGYMLVGAPATEVGPFSITGDNLAEIMLRDSYLEYPEPRDQDAFFVRASAELFGRLVGGQARAVSGIERAIDEARFMAWSADSAEQALLASTAVGGAFLEGGSALGVFVNDGSGAKIGYYVDVHTDVVDHLCTDGSLAGQTVTVTLAHTFAGDVDGLPDYVATGAANYPDGEFHANVRLFPATGMGVTSLERDGEPSGINPETLGGRSIASARVALLPGESTGLVFEVAANVSGLRELDLVVTPGPKPNVYSTRSDDLLDGC